MTARIWAETIRQLDSLDWPEARLCAKKLRDELEKFSPRLIRHSYRDEASVAQAEQIETVRCTYIVDNGVCSERLADKVFVSVNDECPDFLQHTQSFKQGFHGKKNRYSLIGERMRRVMVRVAWNNISLAELRDLNRHRSGYRFAPLWPVGFYLPPDVSHPGISEVVGEMKALVEDLAKDGAPGAHLYGYLLGVQTPFEHSTHADKFIYEVELRTGMGAHFRYAEHLTAAYHEFIKRIPECREYITLGTAEPE
jgi:hypothetical protein